MRKFKFIFTIIIFFTLSCNIQPSPLEGQEEHTTINHKRQSTRLTFTAEDDENNELLVEVQINFSNISDDKAINRSKFNDQSTQIIRDILKENYYISFYDSRQEIEEQIGSNLKSSLLEEDIEIWFVELRDVSLPELLLKKYREVDSVEYYK